MTEATNNTPGARLFGDEDHVFIPRGLIGAACSAIDKKRDGAKVLAELRRYAVGDLSKITAPPAAAVVMPEPFPPESTPEHGWDKGYETGYNDALDEVAHLNPAPAEQSAMVVPDECPHMIVFDDTDRENLIFAGAGARAAALKTWEKISQSWNAHLFVRVERNSRDDKYPSAMLIAAPTPEQSAIDAALASHTSKQEAT